MQIEHVAMYVEDLEKTKDFFIKYFDAKAKGVKSEKGTGKDRSYSCGFFGWKQRESR